MNEQLICRPQVCGSTPSPSPKEEPKDLNKTTNKTMNNLAIFIYSLINSNQVSMSSLAPLNNHL